MGGQMDAAAAGAQDRGKISQKYEDHNWQLSAS